ncbi:MAG: hypothetical protein ACUVTY_02280 [Armatimonadota bacterium]
MKLRFTDTVGTWRAVRSDSPFPVAGGQVLEYLSDEFVQSPLSNPEWVVTGMPSVSGNELQVTNGVSLLSKKRFKPPCLVEAVMTMTARASTDDFRMGFYTDDDNLVEWRATGANSSNMDAVLRAGGSENSQNGLYVSAGNNSYRLASIYIGYGEVVWLYRSVNSMTTRNEVRRYIEHDIPEGPFHIRIAGLAGTSTLKVHRVTAYQLAEVVPPGALGHHVDALATPVRVVNGPFSFSPSSPGQGIVQTSTDTHSGIAAGAVATGSNKSFFTEQVHVQAFFSGDQPFLWWLEAQVDGTNWQVVGYGASTDATADGAVRYFAVSPVVLLNTSRSMRMKVKNTGAAAGTFRNTLVGSVL